MVVQKVVMDFFLEKDIAILTVLYANIQLKWIEKYKTTMQKQIWEALETLKFEEDHNCKDYERW